MAEPAVAQTVDATQAARDYAEHEQTYRFFIRLVRWNVAVIVVILILMAIFLT